MSHSRTADQFLMSSDDKKSDQKKGTKFQTPSPVTKSKLERTEAEKVMDTALENVTTERTKIEDETEALDESKTATEDALGAWRSHAEVVVGVFDRTYDEFDLIAWLFPFAVVAVYFAIIALTGQFGLNTITIGGIGLLITLMIALRLVIWVLWSQIQPESDSFFLTLKESIRGLVGRREFGVSVDTSQVNSQVGSLTQISNKLTIALRSYVPGLDSYYEGRERIHDLNSFNTTLRNALREYGFPLTEGLDKLLLHFGPKVNTDDERLDEIVPKLSSFLKAPQEMVKLAFFDYQGEKAKKKNVWEDISNAPKLVSEFTRKLIENGVVNTEYLEKGKAAYPAVEKIVTKVDPFDLRDFIQSYNAYYGEFARQKDTLLESLETYRVEVSDQARSAIKEFVPKSFFSESPNQEAKGSKLEDPKLEELFAEAAKRVPVEMLVLEVLYYERKSLRENRVDAWVLLVRSEKALDNLVSILTAEDSGLVEIPTFYENELDTVRKFISGALKGLPDFTLARGRAEVKGVFTDLAKQKELLINCARSNNLFKQNDDLGSFDKLLPVSNAQASLIHWIAEQTSVDDTFVLLFYYEYSLQQLACKNNFIALKSDQRKSLANILLSHKIITGSEQDSQGTELSDERNLAEYLQHAKDYNRTSIQAGFSKYNSIFELASGMLQTLKKEGLFDHNFALDFGFIMDELPNRNQAVLLQLGTVLRVLLKTKSTAKASSDEWEEAFVLATLAFFLVKQEITHYIKRACEMAAGNENASRILYSYSRINDNEIRTNAASRTLFRDILTNTMTAKYGPRDYDQFEPFRGELEAGNLFLTLTSMMAVKFNKITPKIDAMYEEAKARKTVELFRRALHRMLTARLKGPSC